MAKLKTVGAELSEETLVKQVPNFMERSKTVGAELSEETLVKLVPNFMERSKTVGEELAVETEQIYDEAFEMSENLPPANSGNTDAQYEVLQVAKTNDLKRPSKRRFQHLKVAVVVVVVVIIVALVAVVVFLVTRDRTTTNGGWSVWSAWSSCSETFETSKTGLKTRQRQCNNPLPSGEGKYCEGNAYDSIHCEQRSDAAINGGWSVWSAWSSCSETCQTSKTRKRTRQRQCNNPVPSDGGKCCEGNAYDTTHCEQQTDSDLIKVKGTRAWQSSTWADCYANYSIDGKFDEKMCEGSDYCGCKCSHTNSANSYWVMEFECPATVKIVSPYFRKQSFVERNKNFTISVYNSFEDAVNNVTGTSCITYTGTGIESPVNLSCLQPIYGKALRIQHFFKDSYHPSLQFCEIEVFVD